MVRETASAVGYALTDDCGHRLGSYRRTDDSFVAFDRLGRPLGAFETEVDCVHAIERAAGLGYGT